MPDINSLTTFSGVLSFLAVLALLWRRWGLSGTLFTIAGSAGVAIAWDRWSQRAGDQVHFGALFSGTPLKGSEIAMITSHGPLLIIGLALLTYTLTRSHRVP
jgi:hypothetical protein